MTQVEGGANVSHGADTVILGVPAFASRRRTDLLGRLRGPGLGLPARPGPVLDQMRALGLAATEFGPVGFLADDPASAPSSWRATA